MNYISTSIPGSDASINDSFAVATTQSNDHDRLLYNTGQMQTKNTLKSKSFPKTNNLRSIINDLLKEHSENVQKPDPTSVNTNKSESHEQEQPTNTPSECSNSGVTINVDDDTDDEVEMFELIEVEEELSDGEDEIPSNGAQPTKQDTDYSVSSAIITDEATENSNKLQAKQSHRINSPSSSKCTSVKSETVHKQSAHTTMHSCEYCSNDFGNQADLLAHLKMHLVKPVRQKYLNKSI